MASAADNHYYVPHGAYWPLVGSVALTTTTGGLALYLNDHDFGLSVMFAGIAILIVMFFGWFGTVVKESEAGTYSPWEDKSFRLGPGCWEMARASTPITGCGAPTPRSGPPTGPSTWAGATSTWAGGRCRSSIPRSC